MDTINAYYAGLTDGEGYVGIRTSKNKKGDKIYERYTLQITITNCDLRVLERAVSIWGGHIYETTSKNRIKTCWRWNITSKEASNFLMDIWPYTIIKKEQIEIALQLQERISKMKLNGYKMTNEERQIRKNMQTEIRKYNQREYYEGRRLLFA